MNARRRSRPALRLFAIALLAATATTPLPAAAQDRPDLQAAFNHYQRHELDAATAAFEAVVRSPGTEVHREERVTAHVLLGLLAWRYRLDWERAERELEAALALAEDSAGVLADISRMERQRGRHREAVEAARAALRTAESAAEAAEAARMLGDAALAAAGMAAGTEPPTADRRRERDARALAWLRDAHDALVRVLPENTGLPDLSRTALRVALLAGDGSVALEAWRSYYVTLVAGEDAGVLDGPRRTLETQLPAWGRDSADRDVAEALIRGFAGSALFEEAAIVARQSGLDGPQAVPLDAELRDILAYAGFVGDVRRMSDEYYRRTALGEGDPDRYRDGLLERSERLWSELHRGREAPPRFDPELLKDELARRFRAEFRLGSTAGYFDLHYGHRVVDDSITVEQYGHRAPLRFVSLDGIVSNGFQSWAWDYRAQHGGMATDEAIYQVRPASADDPLEAWRALADSATRAERLERERRETERDRERAREDSIAYLPGLKMRLARQGLEDLESDLEARGLVEEALEARFLAAYREAKFASGIVAHEGRHAIDRLLELDELSLADREYRAKLSEVAFAPRPRLALGGILDRNIGDPTPHGQANARIMRGLLAWMKDHAAEIRGLQTDRPLLPQLDLLRDAQLRAAFRSMDPLAGEPGARGDRRGVDRPLPTLHERLPSHEAARR